MDMLSSAANVIPFFNTGPGPVKGKGKVKKTPVRGTKTGAVGAPGKKALPFQKSPTAKSAKAGSKAKASAKVAPKNGAASKPPFKRTLGKAAGSFKRGSSSGGGY